MKAFVILKRVKPHAARSHVPDVEGVCFGEVEAMKHLREMAKKMAEENSIPAEFVIEENLWIEVQSRDSITELYAVETRILQ